MEAALFKLILLAQFAPPSLTLPSSGRLTAPLKSNVRPPLIGQASRNTSAPSIGVDVPIMPSFEPRFSIHRETSLPGQVTTVDQDSPARQIGCGGNGESFRTISAAFPPRSGFVTPPLSGRSKGRFAPFGPAAHVERLASSSFHLSLMPFCRGTYGH